MSRCLVTGGCGFIGSHVVDALIEAGHEVEVLDDLSTGKLENLNPSAWLTINDIRNMKPDQFFNRIDEPKFDFVFHLAALARIQPSIENPMPSHDVNINGTMAVLEYCRHNNAKLIFSSSSSIYSETLRAMDEGSKKHPKNPYALQKLVDEQYIWLYNELYGMDYCTLRYFNVYGERQLLDGAYAAVVGILLEQQSNGKPLPITNDGEQRRDFTYVKDVARANVKAMDWGGVFNIGTGTNYSINQIADFVGGEKVYIGERVGENPSTLADNRLARLKGWQPTVDIKDWIREQK